MSGLQASQTPDPQATDETDDSRDQATLGEARRRARARFKLRMAQAVAAVLGVLILLVVGLMVYLAFSKYADRQRQATLENGAALTLPSSSAQSATSAAANAPLGLVSATCRLASQALDAGRLVLIFDGQGRDCQRLIILNTNTGALVVDRPLYHSPSQE